MAKSKERQEERLFADEKFIAYAGDFLTTHAAKLAIAFVVVLCVIVVLVVSQYSMRSHEEEVGDYLEEHLYSPLKLDVPPLYAMPGDETGAVNLDVDSILEKVADARVRPYVLAVLARHLFQKGGEANLRRAEDLAGKLRDEYTDSQLYQTMAGGLIAKIREEREFERPEPKPLGPVAPETEGEEKKDDTPPAEKPAEGSTGGEAVKKPADETKADEKKAEAPPGG